MSYRSLLSGEEYRHLLRDPCYRAGIDEWITKPVSIRRLRQDVSELRKKYQAQA